MPKQDRQLGCRGLGLCLKGFMDILHFHQWDSSGTKHVELPQSMKKLKLTSPAFKEDALSTRIYGTVKLHFFSWNKETPREHKTQHKKCAHQYELSFSIIAWRVSPLRGFTTSSLNLALFPQPGAGSGSQSGLTFHIVVPCVPQRPLLFVNFLDF